MAFRRSQTRDVSDASSLFGLGREATRRLVQNRTDGGSRVGGQGATDRTESMSLSRTAVDNMNCQSALGQIDAFLLGRIGPNFSPFNQ
jgi:hypothetical protein